MTKGRTSSGLGFWWNQIGEWSWQDAGKHWYLPSELDTACDQCPLMTRISMEKTTISITHHQKMTCSTNMTFTCGILLVRNRNYIKNRSCIRNRRCIVNRSNGRNRWGHPNEMPVYTSVYYWPLPGSMFHLLSCCCCLSVIRVYCYWTSLTYDLLLHVLNFNECGDNTVSAINLVTDVWCLVF